MSNAMYTITWIADFTAFVGWLGVWNYLRQLPNGQIFNFLFFIFATMRLFEGVLAFEHVPMPDCGTIAISVMRAVVPFLAALYINHLAIMNRLLRLSFRFHRKIIACLIFCLLILTSS